MLYQTLLQKLYQDTIFISTYSQYLVRYKTSYEHEYEMAIRICWLEKKQGARNTNVDVVYEYSSIDSVYSRPRFKETKIKETPRLKETIFRRRNTLPRTM